MGGGSSNILGAALNWAGVIEQYGSNEREANFSAAVSRENQALARKGAADALTRGIQDETRSRLRAGGMRGAQRVAYAGAGVDVGSGTPLDVQAASAGMSELDAQTIRANAAREAFGFTQREKQFKTQAILDQQRASEKQTQTILGGFASTWGAAGGGSGGSGFGAAFGGSGSGGSGGGSDIAGRRQAAEDAWNMG